MLLLAVRRPVLTPEGGLDATGAQGFGRLVLTRSGQGALGLPHLIRSLRESRAEAVILVGPRRVRQARRTLTVGLREILGAGGPSIIELPSPTRIEAQPDSSLVLLVVPEGIGRNSLCRQAERYLDGRNCAVLLVRGFSGPFPRRQPRPLIPEQRRGPSPAAGVHREGPASVTARD
jgi:hypothetical protein